jgi:nitrile hydratase accessory protein
MPEQPDDQLDRRISKMTGEAALPRSNGELVFDSPWESRAFGIAVALHGDRRFDWEEFRGDLIEEITRAESEVGPYAGTGAESSGASYYERWLASLERVLVTRGLLNRPELEARAAEYASGARSDDDH